MFRKLWRDIEMKQQNSDKILDWIRSSAPQWRFTEVLWTITAFRIEPQILSVFFCFSPLFFQPLLLTLFCSIFPYLDFSCDFPIRFLPIFYNFFAANKFFTVQVSQFFQFKLPVQICWTTAENFSVAHQEYLPLTFAFEGKSQS